MTICSRSTRRTMSIGSRMIVFENSVDVLSRPLKHGRDTWAIAHQATNFYELPISIDRGHFERCG